MSPWEQKAEDLARSVKDLLEHHGRDIDGALQQSMSKNEARARLQQLTRLVEALELEVLQAADPDPLMLRRLILKAIKVKLGTVVGTVMLTTATLGTTDEYHALLDTKDKVDETIVCVIEQDKADRRQQDEANGRQRSLDAYNRRT